MLVQKSIHQPATSNRRPWIIQKSMGEQALQIRCNMLPVWSIRTAVCSVPLRCNAQLLAEPLLETWASSREESSEVDVPVPVSVSGM